MNKYFHTFLKESQFHEYYNPLVRFVLHEKAFSRNYLFNSLSLYIYIYIKKEKETERES